MRTLRFVTTNKGKVAEAQAALAGVARVEPVHADATEVQADDWEPVARAKARSLVGRVEAPFIVDDGGLAVDALRGFPGVYSAYVLRTLGVGGILRLMDGVADRRARFECVVAYVGPAEAGAPRREGAAHVPVDGEARTFRGRCDGRIAPAPRAGGHGFGFDPIFVPEGDERTFAEIPTEEKNRVSHRGRALAALAAHLGKGQG